MSYFKSKKTLVQFVEETLQNLKQGSQLTMTIIPGQFEDFSARIVITGSSGDTGENSEPSYFEKLMNTSIKTTPDG